MTETHPPRVAESILESFGASDEFRDAIVGDLAQEHALRAERYGVTAARFWYYRQAVLASPALLRNWLVRARWSDARRLLNVVGLAYLLTMMIEMAVIFAIAAIGSTVGVDFLRGGIFGRSGFMSVIAASTGLQLLVGLIAGTFGPTCAGYLSAKFEEDRPMIASAAFAAASTIFIIVVILLVPATPEGAIQIDTFRFITLRLAAIPLVAACALTGGMIRVWVISRRQVAAASSRPS
jgi:hypothetical protein